MTHSWSLQCLQFLSLICWSLSYLIFFLLLFYFTFSKYKPTQIPKQTKTDRLRCVPEKTINSSKHALHRTPQDRAPKAGVDESLQIWVQFSPIWPSQSVPRRVSRHSEENLLSLCWTFPFVLWTPCLLPTTERHNIPSSYLIFKHQHEDSANTQVDALKQNLGDVFVHVFHTVGDCAFATLNLS